MRFRASFDRKNRLNCDGGRDVIREEVANTVVERPDIKENRPSQRTQIPPSIYHGGGLYEVARVR